MSTASRLLVAAFLFCLLSSGCRRSMSPQPDAVRDVVQRGPLTLTVEAEPPHLQVGDSVTVRVRVDAPAEYDVELPGPEVFEGLDARVVDAPEARPGPSGLTWRKTFRLEPTVSGTVEIPAPSVRYVRRTTSTSGPALPALATQPAASELVSQPLKIEVRSVLTEKDDPTRPRDITGTLLPPLPPLKPWQWVALLGAVLAAVAATLVAWRVVRQRLRRPPAPLLPEVWALRALEELTAQDWFTDGRFRDYYYRLTEIVRCYIERKFGLAAPEMTTEEFFTHLRRGRHTLPYDAERLHAFLVACDLVKYAALRPRREDAEAALRTARAFIHATAASAAAPSEQPGTGAAEAAGTAAAGGPAR